MFSLDLLSILFYKYKSCILVAQLLLRAPLILAPAEDLGVFWILLSYFREIIMKVLTF